MLAGSLSCSLSSCFTGIESTKKVSLSREDKKLIAPSPEEEFFKGVSPLPLAEWQPGKRFIAADNKTILIFSQHGLPAEPDSARIGGKTLSFVRTEPKLEPDGSYSATIVFSDGSNSYRYNSGKNVDTAPHEIYSNQIPMLIDLDMVDDARELLKDKDLWLKTPLWYDNNGNRVMGKKFAEVSITDVQSGDLAFPLRVKFSDANGKSAWLFMNYGVSGSETRTFSNLFSLSDIRKRYPQITDETWDVICNGNVKIGMTKEECKLSLGNPNDVNRGHDYSQILDLWQYPNGTVLWFEDGLLTRFRK